MMIPANDEKRIVPQKFFHFFSTFFNRVQRSMPMKKTSAEKKSFERVVREDMAKGERHSHRRSRSFEVGQIVVQTQQ